MSTGSQHTALPFAGRILFVEAQENATTEDCGVTCTMEHRIRLRLLAVMLASIATGAKPATAASITLYETRLDEIFSQASFGDTPVDIRFLEPVELVAPELLDIDSEAEYERLRFTYTERFPVTTIRMFFVDRIGFCGKPKRRGIGGCTNSTIVVLDAQKLRGNPQRQGVDELMAHELAHIFLGNGHSRGRNLMNPSMANGRDELSPEQVSRIVNGRVGRSDSGPLWVQSDERGRYIEIVPVLVVAKAGDRDIRPPRRY